MAAQEVAHFGSFERNLETGEGWWSDEVYRILGISPGKDEPTFKNFLKYVHPEDLEGFKKTPDPPITDTSGRPPHRPGERRRRIHTWNQG